MNKVALVPVTSDNIDEILKISVSEKQKNYVAPVEKSLAYAYANRDISQAFGIYSQQQLVGYVLLYFDEKNLHGMWHFMIDQKHQGKGYGKLALAEILAYVKTKPLGDSAQVALAVEADNKAALQLYQTLGFYDTGRRDDTEIVMMLDLENEKNIVSLQTERILLRNFQEKDLVDFFAYSQIDGLGEDAGWLHHQNITEAQARLTSLIKANNVYALVDLTSEKVIGHLSVLPDSEDNHPLIKELGFVLHPDFQKQGLMTEVVTAVSDFLLQRGIIKVYAYCFQENVASRNLIEKCGFILEQEGTFFAEPLNKNFKTFEYVKTPSEIMVN
ncbi:RimJ/RimL family protein N-acetyltransferase [Enterococcus sp. PF1-24]|uniref:GNAT family N-acetyltransferase n=1 Tax=unclassified Enterococcus TaxID=2608891 RepID=UPI00247698A3|nr:MULTISPECIES: GNAT family N-acetyltransferase [unclassified Enterococcus]MDH6364121.1 RimJ/RimL family protein N-acetyltransferase [Enterococcus sp. PFB1-1]MDH6401222.1 RimJ/RimL family protein N-acetyltransferase [Enterococcus sp. PF1-24]